MNKSGLIDIVTVKLGDRRAASEAVEAVVDAITRSVAKGEKVGITGFGVFEKVERAPRTARNPTTGAAVKLKRTTVPRFRPGQGFKDIVSGAKKVPSGPTERAVTARAGKPSATGAPAKAAARTTPRAAAKAPAKAPKAPARAASKAPAAPAKALAKVAKAPSRTVKAPGRSTVAAPSVRAAAAKAPAKAPVKAPVKAPAKRTPSARAR